VASPVAIFCNSFYSASAGSDTWIRCNGLTFISAYQSKKVRAIDKLVMIFFLPGFYNIYLLKNAQ
jgi:hypothetical protein